MDYFTLNQISTGYFALSKTINVNKQTAFKGRFVFKHSQTSFALDLALLTTASAISALSEASEGSLVSFLNLYIAWFAASVASLDDFLYAIIFELSLSAADANLMRFFLSSSFAYKVYFNFLSSFLTILILSADLLCSDSSSDSNSRHRLSSFC